MSRIALMQIAIRPAVLLVILAAGCGPSDGYKGDRGTVSGKITYDGKPIPDGSQVLFIGKEAAYTAAGVVKSGGLYSLVYNGSPRLPAMKYDVQISPPIEPVTPNKTIDPAKVSTAIKSNAGKATEETGPFPSRYYSRNSSKLEFAVKSGSNKADFDLVK